MTDQLRFSPEAGTIRVGQHVVWRNVSRTVHTVTFDSRMARNPNHAALPPGVQPFSTGNVVPGQTVNFRFTIPGQYRYFCIPHEQQRMLGVLNVLA